MSVEDAKEQAERMGVSSTSSPSSLCSEGLYAQLAPLFEGTADGHYRREPAGTLPWCALDGALNKRRRIVLTTGNKSEMAVGYTTLYGDMAGGFDVLKDVPKTLVFKAVRIPQLGRLRDPAAGRDRPLRQSWHRIRWIRTACPYDILDAILRAMWKKTPRSPTWWRRASKKPWCAKVIRLVDLSEYKRRQAAVGPASRLATLVRIAATPLRPGSGKQNW